MTSLPAPQVTPRTAGTSPGHINPDFTGMSCVPEGPHGHARVVASPEPPRSGAAAGAKESAQPGILKYLNNSRLPFLSQKEKWGCALGSWASACPWDASASCPAPGQLSSQCSPGFYRIHKNVWSFVGMECWGCVELSQWSPKCSFPSRSGCVWKGWMENGYGLVPGGRDVKRLLSLSCPFLGIFIL